MEFSTVIRIALVLGGGVMEGFFPLPLKLAPKWSWESPRGAGSLVALLLIPWLVALLMVPHITEVYAGSSLKSLTWGIKG